MATTCIREVTNTYGTKGSNLTYMININNDDYNKCINIINKNNIYISSELANNKSWNV